jgi:hypothetical protein
MDKLRESQPLRDTKQLIFTKGVDIFPDDKVLELLSQNFDRNKKISVYVGAGDLGTGKSSHQNTLLKRSTNNLSDRSVPFYVLRTPLTLTQGVWIYPYPLYAPGQPDVQILLIDLEGMDGVKAGNAEDTMLNLIKIYTLGMMMSSVFTVHVEMKAKQTTINILRKAFDICRTFKSDLNLDPPKLFLLMKDLDSSLYVNETKEVKDRIEKQLEDFKEERDQLIILGRGDPQNTFKESDSKNCSELIGTSYLKLVDKLIETISQNPKVDPTSINSPISLEGFLRLVKTACNLLNDENFQKNLIMVIDSLKLEKLYKIYTESSTQFVNNSLEEARTISLDTSLENFKDQLAVKTEKCIESFRDRVSQVIKSSISIELWTKKHEATFRATAKSMGAIETFASRKIAAEENEELRVQQENLLQQQKQLTEAAKKSAKNLQKSLLETNQKHKELMKKSKQKNDEKLKKMAQTTLEKIKKLEEQGVEMAENHKKEFAELQKTFQDELAKRENELQRRKFDLDQIEERRKADAETHAEEMKILEKLLGEAGRDPEERRREIERMHEKEMAWQKADSEQKLAHKNEMHQWQIQMYEAQAKKK